MSPRTLLITLSDIGKSLGRNRKLSSSKNAWKREGTIQAFCKIHKIGYVSQSCSRGIHCRFSQVTQVCVRICAKDQMTSCLMSQAWMIVSHIHVIWVWNRCFKLCIQGTPMESEGNYPALFPVPWPHILVMQPSPGKAWLLIIFTVNQHVLNLMTQYRDLLLDNGCLVVLVVDLVPRVEWARERNKTKSKQHL